MLKFILLFSILCIFFTQTNPSGTSVARSYCSMKKVCPNQSSVACSYTRDSTIKCNGVLLKLSRTKILQWHNGKRNLIALGKIPGFKPSRRMGLMRYSPELEQMAKYNVMRCIFQHDKCRNTNMFTKSGQNLFQKSYSKKTETSFAITKKGVIAWFAEYPNSNMAQMQSYYSTKKSSGHFTVMVKYDNDRVGCAASKFKRSGKTYVIFACNYATTNIIGKPIYAKGPTASKCKTGRSQAYPGLCSGREIFPH